MKFTRFNLGNGGGATAIAIVLLAAPFLIRPYVVSGGSMEPTYPADTMVIAESLTARMFTGRGDVLVIRNPHQKEVIEIKRVVGLPGELVEMGDFGIRATNREGKTTVFENGTEIGGTNNGTFRIQLGPEDYFVLGDNRSKSSDSREFGAVQKVDIIGRVIMKI